MLSSTFSSFAGGSWAGSRSAREHGLQFGYKISGTLRGTAPRLRAVQHKSDDCCVFRLRHLFRQVSQSFWFRDAHWKVERLFGEFIQAVESRAAARQNKSGGNLAVQACA